MATAPAKDSRSSGPSGTRIRPHWRRGPAQRRVGPTGPSPAAPAVSTTTSRATSRTTSAPRSWGAASSVPRRGRGRISSGRAGGATTRHSARRSSCSRTTNGRASRCPTRPSTSSTHDPRTRSGRRRPPRTARTSDSAEVWRRCANSSTPTSSTPCTSRSLRSRSDAAAGSGNHPTSSSTASTTSRSRVRAAWSITCSGVARPRRRALRRIRRVPATS
jgi:hypothetical protein